jgi:FHS family L-fucose permease-like MFS transporter
MAITSTTMVRNQDTSRNTTDVRAMSIATALFFMWGLLTSLNDILIPHLKLIFELSNAQAALVQTAFFFSYFVFALPAGKLVEWRGYKQSMIAGLLVAALGALLFLPAAGVASFNLFLSALVVLAAGITCLQVAANPYVTSLGPEKTAASRLNLSQAFNSLGTILGPVVGGVLILSATQVSTATLHSMSLTAQQAFRVAQASSVRMPYLGMALVLALLAVALGFLKLPALTNRHTQDFRPGAYGESSEQDSIWRHQWLLLGAVGIFVYVGAEVSIGSFLIGYFEMPNIGALTAVQGAKYVGFYWGGAMVGRFLGSAVLRSVRTGVVLAASATIAGALVLTSMATHGSLAVWTILAVGLFNSVMFPNIFSLGLWNLGPLTSKGSSVMVMAIVGGAVLPLLYGKMADHFGYQHAFVIPVLCYAYIAIFGFSARGLMTSTNSVVADAEA